MLKKITSFILLLALVFQCFLQLGVLAYYNFNKAYITNTFCVNKDKPQLHCDGQCYLQKQLQKTGANHPPHDTLAVIEIPAFLVTTTPVLTPSHQLLQVYVLPLQPVRSLFNPGAPFHPPEVA
ncbi:hypothetical protein [Chitinophaga defluvii]|uniref:Secreted protein n=1 Tax=Chitinophaga defluvii TaxID=3163343 RepID=A0ABV2T6E6_9BACT